MEDVKFLNFADLFLNPQYTELDEITAELKDAGIVAEESQEKIFNILRQKKSELKLQTERRFKEEYLKLKASNIVKESVNDICNNDFVIPYRNKTADTDKCAEADTIKRKLTRQKN